MGENDESAINKELKYNLRDHCHMNTNEDGDRFVGVKVDNDNAMVYFPIGYQIPNDDQSVRSDIRHLIQVLAEFTSSNDRLLTVSRFAAPQSVDFPINAYTGVIEYFLENDYYTEKEIKYISAARGKQDWAKTVQKKMPLVQVTNGVGSFIYTEFIVQSQTPNDNKEITQINKYCVYEAFERLGWLYMPTKPEKPERKIDIKSALSVIRTKRASVFDDVRKNLFQNMIAMLEYMDKRTITGPYYFGTDDFDRVWEKIIDKAFGIVNKDEFFPRSRWILDYDRYKEKYPLMPDTIMLYNDRYYVLDAKCYRYGWTGIPDHLPNGSSINKQITYGEYLEKERGIGTNSIFNAFIMPYNMSDNPFGLTAPMGNIGEAVGDWRHNDKPYERIQGIVMDTRYLMYHYLGNPIKDKVSLAECIEAVLSRPQLRKNIPSEE